MDLTDACTDIFSVVSQTFSEISSLVKKWEGGQNTCERQKFVTS